MFRRPNTPTRFSISELAELSRGGNGAITLRGSDLANSNHRSTSSFGYGSHEQGLVSTQQLKVDWSKFENHTFFNSAVAKVNVAFEKIINGYPFDGTRKELEKYIDDLTGYEKYVLDTFPKNVGYLNFSSSHIRVSDYQGASQPELSKKNSGAKLLDPLDGSYTVEFFLFLPSEEAGSQIVVQKKASDNAGICAYVKSGSSSSNAEIAWALFSGSANVVASASIPRGRFVHVVNVYDREQTGKALLYVDGELKASSQTSWQFNSLDTNTATFNIGSGSSFNLGAVTVTPDKTLSGSLDELRVFSTARTQLQISKFAKRNVYAQDGLSLYYKFNEPTGSLSGDEDSTVNSIVLDSSGNGLHANISGFEFSLRSTGSVSVPLTNERMDLNPVVFPGYEEVRSLNDALLLSASYYDDHNPNIITRLVPKHYITDGQEFEGLSRETGYISDSYGGDAYPGQGQLGSTQLFLALLYTWAKYFDELKLFVDAFSKLHYVNYDEDDTSPDAFLPFAMKHFGFKMPNLFSDAAFDQYKDGEDVETSYSLNETSLASVQNQIMRRVLTNMGDIVRSKGTIHSIEVFLRSVGIDPNNTLKIKEYGGPTKRALDVARETRIEPFYFFDLSQGGRVTSTFLSSSRVEPGLPTVSGTMVPSSNLLHGVSSSPDDGLWTSGSWTFEANYKWLPKTRGRSSTQSLLRVYTTSSVGLSERLVLNLLAVSGSDPKVVLYARPGDGTSFSTSPMLALTASADIFDGDPWSVSVGRVRNDLSGSGFVSSSYFVRVAKQAMGDVSLEKEAVAYFNDVYSSDMNVWQKVTTTSTSGTFARIGSEDAISSSGNQFLNATSGIPTDALNSTFDGQVNFIRFWSKSLSKDEWLEHVRNPHSLGVSDPHSNFNFNTTLSGSWQRLRMDVTVQQTNTESDEYGGISLFDYSQNNKHLSGSGLTASTKLLKPYMVGYSHISPSIDEAVSSDKVRVRGYEQYENVKRTPWAQVAPVYEVPRNEQPQDDSRLSIEFSLVDALNRDIVTMFSTLDALDNAIGAPENDFSSEYKDLEHLKQIYFNRLSGKLNFKAFFEFFRWFDSSVSYFIDHLIPRKTIFNGTNFVVESHLLERHKKQYFHYDMYLSEGDKPLIEDRILLQNIAGTVRKF